MAFSSGLLGTQPGWLQAWLEGRGITDGSATQAANSNTQQYTSNALTGARDLYNDLGSDHQQQPYNGVDISLDPSTATVADLIAAGQARSALGFAGTVLPGVPGLMMGGANQALGGALANAQNAVLGSYYPGSDSVVGTAVDYFNDAPGARYDDGGTTMQDTYQAGGTTTGGWTTNSKGEAVPVGGSVYDYETGKWSNPSNNPFAGLFGNKGGPATWYGGPQTKSDLGLFIDARDDTFYDQFEDAMGNMSLADEIAFGLVDGVDPSEAGRYGKGGDLYYGDYGLGWHKDANGNYVSTSPTGAYVDSSQLSAGGDYGAEGQYAGSAQQQADIDAAQDAHDAAASSMNADGSYGGDDGEGWGGDAGWGGDWGDWGSDAY